MKKLTGEQIIDLVEEALKAPSGKNDYALIKLAKKSPAYLYRFVEIKLAEIRLHMTEIALYPRHAEEVMLKIKKMMLQIELVTLAMGRALSEPFDS